MDDHYIIDTPENIEFSFAVAGIGSRFLAAIIDTLILLLLQLALGLTLTMIGARLEQGGDGTAASILVAVWALLSFALLWGYYLVFEMLWNGQSPGKRMIKLRVVRTGGHPITFVASAIRNLVRVIDFLPTFYGVGVLVMFIDQRARRLGDLAAGTLVVKERRAVTLESLTTRATPVPPLPPFGAVDSAAPTPLLPNLHLLTDEDYDLIQEFLRRRAELGPDSRRNLSDQLAAGLRTRLGLPQGGNAEMFLEHLTREYRVWKSQEPGVRSQESGVPRFE